MHSVRTPALVNPPSCRAHLDLNRPSAVRAPPSHTLPILHLRPASLLHLRLPLTRPGLGLWHARSIRKPAPHARIRRPSRIRTVQRNHAPQPPRLVAQHARKEYHAVGPVDDVPHVFCESFGFEVFAGALDGAVRGECRARLPLEGELDEDLGRGEEEVEEEGAPREAGVEEDGAEEPEEAVDEEGEVEGLVEAGRVGGREGFGGFLGGG